MDWSVMAYSKPRQWWETNRDVKRHPKSGRFWCGKCDRALVVEWTRCRLCGSHNGESRHKKPVP